MLGEVVGGDEGQDAGLQALQVVVVVDRHRGVLDRAVHALGLAIGPRVAWLGEPVLDAVVGQHGVDLVGEGLDHAPEEGRTCHLARLVVELDVGELRGPVDRQEHDQLAVGVAHLAAVDVDVADRRS